MGFFFLQAWPFLPSILLLSPTESLWGRGSKSQIDVSLSRAQKPCPWLLSLHVCAALLCSEAQRADNLGCRRIKGLAEHAAPQKPVGTTY